MNVSIVYRHMFKLSLDIAERKLGLNNPQTISIREGLENLRQKKRDFYGE